MTAYNVNEYKRNFSFAIKKECITELLSEYQINPWAFFLNGMMIIGYEVLNYDIGIGIKK